MSDNTLKETRRRRSMLNKGYKHYAQEVEIFNADDLEENSPPMKSAKTEKSTKPTKILTRSTETSSERSRSHERSQKSAEETPAMAVVITKMTEESK